MAVIDTASSNVSPIEAATRVHNLVYLGYVVVVVLAAFFTWLAWKTGNKVQDAIRADANARIAEADSKAEVAKHGAAKANEGAATANGRATALENANLNLRAQVATLEAGAANAAKDVARLQREAADAKAAQQNVELELEAHKMDLATQQERAANAERSLLELQHKVADRHLTPAQREAVLQFLKANPDSGLVSVACVGGNPEPQQFAGELAAVLRESGWTVHFDESSIMIVLGGNPKGLAVEVQDDKHPPLRAAILQTALRNAGVELTGHGATRLKADDVVLFVGSK